MIKSLLMPLLAVLFLSVGQVGFKLVGNRLTPFETLYSAGTVALVAVVLVAYAVFLLAWLYMLSYMDLSRAIMFYSLTFLIVPLLGWAMLGEQISLKQAIGAAVIVFGVVLSAQA